MNLICTVCKTDPAEILEWCHDCYPAEDSSFYSEEDYLDPKDDLSGRVPSHWLSS